MKKILSLTFLLTFIGIKAQNNLVVFSENGEKFFLIINGVKQNLEAETNVKVTDLIQPTYKAKIIFEDKSKGVVDQNIYFMQGGEPVKNHEFVFSVGIKKKGIYKARPVSAVAIAPQTKSDPEQTVVHYATTEPTKANNNVISDGNSSGTINIDDDGTALNNTTNTNTQIQTITKTQTQSNANANPNNSNVAVNLSINENNLGMNGGGSISMNGGVSTSSSNAATTNANTSNSSGGMNVNTNNLGMNGGGNVNMNGGLTTTTSQTVTTTTTKTSGGTTATKANSMSSEGGTKTPTTTTKARAQVDNGAMSSTGGGCAAMSTADFNAAKESIGSKSFDDSKLKVAKQVLDNNCMSSAQVKEVIGLFSFEQSKLDLAKYAYGRTTDKNNYYKINDAFTFESSITELDNHIKKSNK
jgi:hypothetical protein